jgi:hypothetical protein
LPHDPRQSGDPSGASWPATSATAVPGTSAEPRAGAVSGLVLKPSAISGTAPDLTGQTTSGTSGPTGPVALTRLSTARYR